MNVDAITHGEIIPFGAEFIPPYLDRSVSGMVVGPGVKFDGGDQPIVGETLRDFLERRVEMMVMGVAIYRSPDGKDHRTQVIFRCTSNGAINHPKGGHIPRVEIVADGESTAT